MLMMRPARRLIMARTAARARRKPALRFMSSTACQSSSFIRMASMSRVMPALLTRMSILPVAVSAAAHSLSASATSPRLLTMTCVRSPRDFASSSSAAARVPVNTTTAPCACSARAMAPPMPPDAPVTSAALPVRSNIISLVRKIQRKGAKTLRNFLVFLLRAFASLRFNQLLQDFQQRLDLRRLADGRGFDLAVDALHQAGQHLARPDLRDLVDALRLHIGDALAPAHHARHLLHQQAPDGFGIAHLLRRHVGD